MKHRVAPALLAALVGACSPPAADPAGVQQAALLEQGHAQMVLGDPEAALSFYQRAAATGSLGAEVQAAIGTANLRLGRIGQAETWLRAAVESDPQFVSAWNNLGVVLVEQGNFPEARLVFRRAFALDSGASEEIRENLRLAIAKSEKPAYNSEQNNEYELIRQGSGAYRLLSTGGQRTE